MTVAELLQFLENIPEDAQVWIWKASWDDFDTDTSCGDINQNNVWYQPQDNAVKFW